MADEMTPQTDSKNKNIKRDYTFAVGRRKAAVARVRLYTTIKDGMMWNQIVVNKGDIIVNEKPIAEYFSGETNRYRYSEPFRVVNAQNKFTVTALVKGGGPGGQLEAVIAGIATALSKFDEKTYRETLKSKGFLTRDSRVRERRMVGTGGKSRRQKQSPKR